MPVVRIGIVGGGLMGRELAAAVGRWAALSDHPVQPRLEAVCDPSAGALAWFERIASVRTLTGDRRRLLEDPALDVLYLAVPHHLHEELYLDAIAAGKDFLGEKPFGIDLAAARRIVAALREQPDVFARCSSEMPYFPGAQLAYEEIRSGALGQMIEARHAFLHSSDLDRGKPINWKRQAHLCGEIGVMGDLGMHVVHLPLRLGWRPRSVYAVLQDIVTERPGPDGEPVACDTWDNATLHVDAGVPAGARDEADSARRDQHLAAPRARDGRRHRLLDREPEGRAALRGARRSPALGAPGDRQPVGVRDRDRADLRVRLLRRDPADVGRLPGRARRCARRPARLRHPRGGAGRPRAVGRRPALGGVRRRGARGRPGRRGAEPFVVGSVLMRMRTTVILAALIAVAVWAAPAQAKLVYVKNAGSAEPVIYVSGDRGKDPRRLGIGRAPTISPNGRWVAFVTPAAGSEKDAVVLLKLEAGSRRLVMRSRSINSLRFSPDSSKLAAIAGGERLRVYDIASDRVRVAAAGEIRGYSFSPDSARVVVGRARNDRFQAPSDLFTGPALGGKKLVRITDVGRAINPVWGPEEIVFDRFRRRRDDAPAFNLWAVAPTPGSALRQLTGLTIPPLVSGLVPLEFSADARRLLAVFTGQDTQVGFTVATRTGRTRALSMDFETGLVGFDISANGKRILAHSGGGDPGAAHDVLSLPYDGKGEPKVLVENAAYPDWTR